MAKNCSEGALHARSRAKRCDKTRLHVHPGTTTARLAQSAERKTLNLVVVGSSPTLGEVFFFWDSWPIFCLLGFLIFCLLGFGV